MKTYSIIIPHRNNIDGLLRLLKSIYDIDIKSSLFEEFKKNLTVYIIDDYSDKQEVEKLLDLNRNYKFTLLFNEGVRSAGACRNIGLQNCNSDYVLFSDSDDFFAPNYFDVLLNLDNNDSDIIFFSPISVLDDDISRKSDRHIFYENVVKKYLNNKNAINERILRFRWLGPWSKRFKRSFLDLNKINFDETIASNDVMFSVKSGYFAEVTE